ncbi:YchJ family protein [Rhodocyclaceae bacterium]
MLQCGAMKKTKALSDTSCPCGSGNAFVDCCGQYLDGRALAPTAEHLMRSRYSAYVQMNMPYLLATWHPSTRPTPLDLTPTQWLGLSVERHTLQDANHATVVFVARYKVGGRAYKLAETSRFVREEGRWFYLDGTIA